MPITDPVPDEAIVQGFKHLRDHQTEDPEGHGHGHPPLPHQHQPPKPPPPPRNLHNEGNRLHEGPLPAATGGTGTGTYHQQDGKNEDIKFLLKKEADSIQTKQRTIVQPTSPTLSPFPDVDIFLLNDSAQPQSVPVQSQGARGIIEVLPPAQLSTGHPETLNDKRPEATDQNATMVMIDGGHIHHHHHKDEYDATTAPVTSTKGLEKGGGNLKDGVLERPIVAQWPPPHQVNHPYVEAYERQGRDTGYAGESEGGELMENERPKGIKNWFRPSVWLDRKFYKVGIDLKNDWRVQASFFAKVILTKATQLLLINLWMLLVALTPEVREIVADYHNWMFFPLGMFLLTLITVRIISKSKAGWFPLLSLAVLILMTILLAYSLAAVTFAYNAYCIPMVTITLFLVCITMPFVPYMTQSAVIQPIVTRIGAVLVLTYAVFILVVVAYTKQFADMAQFATLIWFPGLLMAEMVLWVMMYEIQRVVGGLCFNVSERRWCFTALYV